MLYIKTGCFQRFLSGLLLWRVPLRDLHCVHIDSGKASFALASNSIIMVARLVVMWYFTCLYALPA